MNNRQEKLTRYQRAENVDLQGRTGHPVGNKSTWLTGTLLIDEQTRRCQERAVASELFLQHRLFPFFARRSSLDEQALIDLLVEFKRSRRDLDRTFEMAQVMACMLGRFKCHMLDSLGETAMPSETMQNEVDLFATLSELDLQKIDEAVRLRVRTG